MNLLDLEDILPSMALGAKITRQPLRTITFTWVPTLNPASSSHRPLSGKEATGLCEKCRTTFNSRDSLLITSVFALITEQFWHFTLGKSSSDSGAKVMNLIGPRVRQLREKQQLTQEELATKCNLFEWDISRGTLAKIESQVRRVTDEEAALLAKALKVEINALYE